MKNFTIEEEEKIVKDYVEGKSKNKLRLEYGVSEGVIKRILIKHNIPLRPALETHKRKYNINDGYFDIQSPNMAYILGLWAADGNVSSKENRLDLELNSLDIEILERIREELDSDRPIKTYICQNGYTKNKLLFWSSKIKRVFSEYGIVPNKTYSEDFSAPHKLKKEYWIDYIRGFFDGDGCVKKGTSLTFELNSINKNFLQEIQHFLLEYYGIHTEIGVAHSNYNYTMYRLYCYGERARLIFQNLYTPNSLYLERKYRRWLELIGE